MKNLKTNGKIFGKITLKTHILMEDLIMDLHEFVNKYFNGWNIAGVTTCGTDCGNIKLCHGETKIKIFFNLHGKKHWTDYGVTVNHIEGCSGTIF